MEENTVYQFIESGSSRQGRRMRYSATADTPPGFEPCEQRTLDISDIMQANGWSKETALEMMNL